ncbi:SHOCT domain-containing protein [Streptacidiphilus neutrinimicus]|uniref:SHOCT domain-containing protein n=1 Tax=Streptacidiphilus neutrinimicus TaxID=105420 RepID=UPI001F3EE901|nr:SHOCT domain-containing protein [Streptacidiphilus neutrinimicus]
MNLLVWIWFGLMSAAFMPLCLLASQVPGPNAVHIVLYVFIIGVLWWGSFGYGMYLSMAGMGGGDKRLLKRGIRGTARILAVKGTNTYINGQPDLGYAGRRVYRYTVHVELPGREPYETYVSVASHQFQEGQTVQVAASRHNHKRVAIDAAASAQQRLGAGWQAGAQYTDPQRKAEHRLAQQRLAQQRKAQQRKAQQHQAPQRTLPNPYVPQDAVPQDAVPHDAVPRQAEHGGSGHGNARHGDEGERLRQLSELGRLHKEGVLSDEEFASEKARILGFSS